MKITIRQTPIVTTKFMKMLLCSFAVIIQMFFLSFKADSQLIFQQRITWGGSGATLKSAFAEVEKLSGVTFNYSNSSINDQRTVNVPRAERTLGETIGLLLKGTPLTFKLAGESNVLIVSAQASGKIAGKVTDAAGVILPGASVKIVELNKTTAANTSGMFTISAEPGAYTIEVSFISFQKKRIPGVKVTSGNVTSLNVSLLPEANQLKEVMVTTALGIKREERALGYATTVVAGDQLTNAISNNWTEALSGKVAGLNLIRSNSGPTGSNKIILRGENTLTSNNEALIIVDGVVINNSSGQRRAIQGESAYGTSSDNMPADYGSSLDDINPDDIESVSVLKGPGAAALYGQRGANGAIFITTKAGSSRTKGVGITVNSNFSLESVNRWPDLQFEYGQGLDGAAYYSYGASADGASTSGTSSAYGPRFDGQMFYQFDPVTQKQGTERTPWVPYTNKIRQFFDTGKTFTNTVSLEGGTDKTTARFSATNVKNTWITPNTGYGRNSFALAVNSKPNQKLSFTSRINFTNKHSDNLPGAGYGNQSLMYWFIFWQPSADIDWLKNYWKLNQKDRAIEYPFSSYPENPYAISYEFINTMNRNVLTGNVQATYNFTRDLSLAVRTTMDFSYDQREQRRPYDAGTKYPKGSFRTQDIYSEEATADFLLRYNKKVSKDIDVSVTGGGSMLANNYKKDEIRADSLTYPGIYRYANSAGPLVNVPDKSGYHFNSLYGMFTASYKDYMYLDLTGREDWTSVLATPQRTDNVGFFYPSVNLSFVASDAFKLPDAVSYAKLRASVAGVGSGGTTPYMTAYSYQIAGSGLYTGGGLQNPATLPNPNLKPLYTTTYEAGAEARFLKNRVGFDLTLYTGNTKNQILTRIVDRSTGFDRMIINAGQINNKGVELALNGSPLKSRDGLNWSANFTMSANRNKITELADSSVVLRTGPVAGGQIVAKVGGSMGDLYGRGYVRSPDGQVVYDETTGFAKITDDVVYLGNTTPKWRFGFSNDFRYKQFHLNLLFDAQFGAVAHSLSNYKLVEQGKLKSTLPGRYNGIIGKGVLQNPDGSYRPNDVLTFDIDEYYRSQMGTNNAEGSTFSTDFIKFREARLDYSLASKVAQRFGFQRASIGVYGRDLFIWTKWPIFDPEFGTLSDTGDIVQGFEVAQFPSTRTIGLNLTLGF